MAKYDDAPKLQFVTTTLAMLALALTLCGCGSGLFATTQQARDAAQSSSLSAVAQAVESSQSIQLGEHQVLVEVDTSNAAAYNGKYPETLGTFVVDVQEGATVLDVLKETGVDVALRGKDYVLAIGGVEERACGRDSGWIYLVDGVMPMKSASDYELAGGETVRWAYTVTEGDVGAEDMR